MVCKNGLVSDLHSLVQVTVGHDHQGTLAAQLQRDSLQIGVGGCCHDEPPGESGACEGHLVYLHVTGKSRPGSGSVAGHNVDHSWRQPRLPSQVTHVEGREGRQLRGLEDYAAASGQGWTPLPGQHCQGIVPGYDLTHHSDRLQPGVGHHLSVSGDGVAVYFVRPARIVSQNVNGLLHVGQGGGEGLPIVDSVEAGQVVLVPLHQVHKPQHQSSSPTGVHSPPC